MSDDYYGKPYHVSQLFQRNSLIVKYSDSIIAFRSEGKSSGTDHAIQECKKLNKPFVIVSEKN
jgi:hypothetical protein